MSNGAPRTTNVMTVAGDGIDTTLAHPARRYDYWLGGKTNFAADRASGDAIAAAFPGIRTAAHENRAFRGRAVSYLAEAGITQFVDLGTGIPTSPNTHEIAQRICPGAHVLYVDSDPIVSSHSRALLTSSPPGRTSYLHADIRDTDRVLGAAAELLDVSQPIGLLAAAVFHFLPDDDHPRAVLRTYLDALLPGSCLAFSHATLEDQPAHVTHGLDAIAAEQVGAFYPRTLTEVTEFLTGLHLVDPGVVPTSQWRPDPRNGEAAPLAEAAAWAAVGRVH